MINAVSRIQERIAELEQVRDRELDPDHREDLESHIQFWYECLHVLHANLQAIRRRYGNGSRPGDDVSSSRTV